jgi:hypothetical protein
MSCLIYDLGVAFCMPCFDIHMQERKEIDAQFEIQVINIYRYK